MTRKEFRDKIYFPTVNQGWTRYDKMTNKNTDITDELKLKAYDDKTLAEIFSKVKQTAYNTCLDYSDSLTYLLHTNKI